MPPPAKPLNFGNNLSTNSPRKGQVGAKWGIGGIFSKFSLYILMMGEDDDGAVQVHLDGADTAREVIAAEREKKQMLNRKLEARTGR